jgi:hypothetical protein
MAKDEAILNLGDPAVRRLVKQSIDSKTGLWWFSLRRARDQKSLAQLAYLFGVVYQHAAKGIEEAWGEDVDVARAHEFFKAQFLKVPIADKNSGEVKGYASPSVADLDKEEMSVYIEKIIQFSAEQLNTIIPPADLPRTCMGIPPDALKSPCAVGCDVRPGSFDLAIGDVLRRGAKFVARLVFYGKVRDENDVAFLCDQYPVRCGVIDVRPESSIAMRFVKQMRAKHKEFWRAQYNTNPTTVEMTLNEREHLLTLERTMNMDEVYFAFDKGESLAIPENYMSIEGGQFVTELKAPTKVPIVWHGEPWWRWTEGADHAFHALNYMLVAMKVGKLWQARTQEIMTIKGLTEGPSGAGRLDGPDEDYIDPVGSPSEPFVGDDGATTWSDSIF